VLAMVGGILQRNGETRSLVQDSAPSEIDSELVAT
jgi:hypothetical protein